MDLSGRVDLACLKVRLKAFWVTVMSGYRVLRPFKCWISKTRSY